MEDKERISLITQAYDKILSASVLLYKVGADREVAQLDMIMKHLANYKDSFERVENGE